MMGNHIQRTKPLFLLFIFVVSVFIGLYLLVFQNSTTNYEKQWALKNFGQKIDGKPGISGVDINFEQPYECPSDFPIIAVIDSDIDINHIQFSNVRFIDGWDFVNRDSTVNDTNDSHGTSVVSVIANSKCKDTKMMGLLGNVSILPIKAFESGKANIDNIIEAIKFAESKNAKIVNCSFTFPDFNEKLYQTIKESNMIFVCSIGNENKNSMLYPAGFDLPNVISVVGINNIGMVSKYSNYHQDATISAPGEMILVAGYNDTYELKNGSSFAAPFISTACAIIFYRNPNANIKEVLCKCSKFLSSLDGKVNQSALLDFQKIIMEEY